MNEAMRTRRSTVGLLGRALLVITVVASTVVVAAPVGGDAAKVLVEAVIVGFGGADGSIDDAVERAGGTVSQRFATLDMVVADVPSSAVPGLRSDSSVRAIEENREVELASTTRSTVAMGGVDSLWALGELTGAHDLWRSGYAGQGIDVALIDSGVVPVRGLDDESRILHGPDVSFETGFDDLRHLDTFGHGTHLAGIIAAGEPGGADPNDPTRVQGLAPEARLISVKAADQFGVADVAQILAAIDWVIANRTRDGLNIRVLNLAFATDSPLSYIDDPLSYAVEKAWKRGIVVVVAAGNTGNASPSLPNPARNPYVIAAGSLDTRDNGNPNDDRVAPYSSRGSFSRSPDLVAPGTNIVSLRNPGSYLDGLYPSARIGGSMFRGSGTSQAAAVVSGLAALVVQAHPTYGPDQIKALLTQSADRLSQTSTRLQGAGSVDAADAASRSFWLPGLVRQNHMSSSGEGSLHDARGTLQVIDDAGLVDAVGLGPAVGILVDPLRYLLESLGLGGSDPTWITDDWSGGEWEGNRWAHESWTGNRWATGEWTGNRWAGNRWAGDGWTGNRWATGEWSSARWTTATWN